MVFQDLLHKNLSFHVFSAKSVCFCQAATRHAGQHDTTTIFLVSRPHRMANYGIWPFLSNGGYIWFFWVCGAFIQIWTIGTIENSLNFWVKIWLSTPGGLYAYCMIKVWIHKSKVWINTLPHQIWLKFEFNQIVHLTVGRYVSDSVAEYNKWGAVSWISGDKFETNPQEKMVKTQISPQFSVVQNSRYIPAPAIATHRPY
jgi:hypothetical protein